MSGIHKFILNYDGSQPERARDLYNDQMDDWKDAIQAANDPENDTDVWIIIADGLFETAQALSLVFKRSSRKSIEGDEIEDLFLDLAPPDTWKPFETNEEVNERLWKHLADKYPWTVSSGSTPLFLR